MADVAGEKGPRHTGTFPGLSSLPIPAIEPELPTKLPTFIPPSFLDENGRNQSQKFCFELYYIILKAEITRDSLRVPISPLFF